MFSMTLLDETGDTTIVWDEDTEAKLLPIIEKKMKQGVVFYIIKERMIPMLPPKKVRLKKATDIKAAGAVVVRDEDLAGLFLSGDITTISAGSDAITTVKKAANANEVVNNHTVAVRAQRGG